MCVRDEVGVQKNTASFEAGRFLGVVILRGSQAAQLASQPYVIGYDGNQHDGR